MKNAETFRTSAFARGSVHLSHLPRRRDARSFARSRVFTDINASRGIQIRARVRWRIRLHNVHKADPRDDGIIERGYPKQAASCTSSVELSRFQCFKL